MSGSYACSISVYVQSLFATHAFVMDWRFAYAFCCSFLISCGVNCFLILHPLGLASSKGWALPYCRLFSLLAYCLLLPLACQYFYHIILLSDLCLLGLLWACCMLFSYLVIMTQYGHWIYTHASLGFLDPLHCLWAPLAHFFLLGHPRPICFPWTSSAHFQLYFPISFY